MKDQHQRTAMLLGEEAVERLAEAHVAIFGIGGVGGYTVEALARAGVGSLTLIDSDTVNPTNINRQIIALHSTLGQYKVDVAAARVKDISPDTKVTAYPVFYLPENAEQFDLSCYDYVVDAIDTVEAKVALIENAKKAGVPIISSMGAGNKLDPTAFEISDISKTSVCPLAKVIRTRLRAKGINHLKVVYSKERPMAPKLDGEGKPCPASVSFIPSVVGLIIAGEVVADLTGVRSLGLGG